MSGNYFANAGVFLLDTLLGLYILAFMLRFLFQWARVDFYNPISQFLVKITAPVLNPFRRFIPGLMGLDMAAVVVMLLLQWLLFVGITLIHGGQLFPLALLVVAAAELLKLATYVFMFSIIIQAILSWVVPHGQNPILVLLYSLNEPLLRPARRLLPDMGGLDLSPLLVLIGLQLIRMLPVPMLLDLAKQIPM
ncbi:MAG: YggT family protein [Gammaproteobacteria bacterium]|nr:YggT family protein [Gammaproteobacteria bacterium]